MQTLSVSSLARVKAPADIEAVLPKLLNGETVSAAVPLKEAAVWRVGDHILKLYQRSPKLSAKLRPTRAAGAVQAYLRLQPIPSPRPVHWRKLDHPDFASLLAYEYADGPTLLEILNTSGPNAAQIQKLPGLFAALHAQGILHGDLHGKNLLWVNEAWCIIDLDGLRGPMHALRKQAVTEQTWARLMFDFASAPELKSLFSQFIQLAGNPWPADSMWEAIEARYPAIKSKRLAAGIQPGT